MVDTSLAKQKRRFFEISDRCTIIERNQHLTKLHVYTSCISLFCYESGNAEEKRYLNSLSSLLGVPVWAILIALKSRASAYCRVLLTGKSLHWQSVLLSLLFLEEKYSLQKYTSIINSMITPVSAQLVWHTPPRVYSGFFSLPRVCKTSFFVYRWDFYHFHSR